MHKRQIIASLLKISEELDARKLYREADRVTSIADDIIDDPFDWGDEEGRTLQPEELGIGDLKSWLGFDKPSEPVVPLYDRSNDERVAGAEDIIDSVFGDRDLQQAVDRGKGVKRAKDNICKSLKQKYGINVEIKIRGSMRTFFATSIGDTLEIIFSPEMLFAHHGDLEYLKSNTDGELLKIRNRLQSKPQMTQMQPEFSHNFMN